MRRAIVLGLLFLVAVVSTAAAQPYGGGGGRGKRRAVTWDNNGWTLLGERTVNGRVDRDRIDVGRYEGKFSKLQVVVLDSDLELLEFKINFADRTTYDPRLAYYFKEDASTRAIDLPPGESLITHIDMKYRNVGRWGDAKVQVWGFRINAAPPRPVYTWDTTGWKMLGERTVNGRVDRDTITVGRYEGRFDKLNIVVHDDDMELLEFRITFANGQQFDPRLAFYFRENSRSRTFDLPGDDRVISRIDLKYRNVGRSGPGARVQVWGHGYVAPPRPVYTWDTNGWQMLGERTVNGRVDRDTITVGRYEGRFQKLNIVVHDDDMELLEFKITFADRTTFDPRLSFYFRENSRSRFIDLPPGEHVISRIDLKYRNVGRTGPGARVQVWGQHAAAPRPVAFSWDNRGWRMIGERTVNGRVDRDRINVTYDEGKFRQLMIVVLDSDLELLDFDVTFANNTRWSPNARQYFRENTRTRSIDLPGDRRTIKHIDLKYRNLPGGGNARVQIWGK